MRFVLGLVALVLASPTISASSGRVVDIPERAKGADTVVVGTILDVYSALQTNGHGDQLIVSRAVVLVEETLKGQSAATTISVDVEGGTVGDLTLRVSDMPAVATGERATFFLTRGNAGVSVPYLRGLGILKLDTNERVPGSSLTLAEIRRMVRGSQK
jgi:hypothetical protein